MVHCSGFAGISYFNGKIKKMNKEQIKLKIQRLVNQYNVANYVHVIKGRNFAKKLPNNLFLMNLIGSSFQKLDN